MQIPLIGIGTWELTGKECTNTILKALELGYRHIDTAHAYENHKAIKKAISSWDRKELFITSKMPLEQVKLSHIAKSVEETCDKALDELGLDVLDLYLIHWPDHTLPLSEIFAAMESLVQKKKIKKAGVSNFNIHHLEDLKKDGYVPAANQVEFHPYLYQKELLDYCKKEGIKLIAYRPLGKGKLLTEPLLATIGKKHNKSPAQVVLRWLVQKEIPAIPKAATESHMRENLQIFDFSLSQEDVQKLDHLNKNKRFCSPENTEFTY